MTEAFDWKNCWYPVLFDEDLRANSIHQFALYDEEFILWRDTQGVISCLRDRCPHRAAKLSTGKIVGDVVECQYHGWQFDGGGSCASIPQLEKGQPMPEKACVESFPVVVEQGMVWFYRGSSDDSGTTGVVSIPDLDKSDFTSVDYVVDLPYDQSYLIENVIDVAHIHIAHHGIRGGGHRAAALPLEFNIVENSASRIRSEFRSIGLPNSESSPLRAAIMEFVAPNLIHYVSEYKDERLGSGLALYSLPLGMGRCRLLYRKYSNFSPWRERIKPRWLEHFNQNTILQQDMAIIIGQYDVAERSGKELSELWQPIKSCDQLVLAYRRWLDEYGGNLPFYRGYRTSRITASSAAKSFPSDNYQIHTRQCRDCTRVHSAVHKGEKIAMGLGIILVLLLAISESEVTQYWSIAGTAICIAAFAGLSKFRKIFE